eukprot:6060148-Prymnesium_polylepis.1
MCVSGCRPHAGEPACPAAAVKPPPGPRQPGRRTLYTRPVPVLCAAAGQRARWPLRVRRSAHTWQLRAVRRQQSQRPMDTVAHGGGGRAVGFPPRAMQLKSKQIPSSEGGTPSSRKAS